MVGHTHEDVPGRFFNKTMYFCDMGIWLITVYRGQFRGRWQWILAARRQSSGGGHEDCGPATVSLNSCKVIEIRIFSHFPESQYMFNIIEVKFPTSLTCTETQKKCNLWKIAATFFFKKLSSSFCVLVNWCNFRCPLLSLAIFWMGCGIWLYRFLISSPFNFSH